jgi:arsenite/tail-anchored protein-transporting ATPase
MHLWRKVKRMANSATPCSRRAPVRDYPVARFTFFIGKGGVGKSTVSSAYALHRAAARSRERVLLISSDPAHSLGDVLQLKIDDSPARLRTPGQLWARQLDADRQIKQFLARERADILALLAKGSFFRPDELEPLLDTSLPGIAEVAALLAVHALLDSDYNEIVVDTAPMGHAIRLFQMPEHFARFLNVLETAAARDEVLAQTFGGRAQREPALARWSQMVERVEQALSAEDSRLVLVTTPEPFSLNEVVRSAPAFTGQPIGKIVLNRAVQITKGCSRCQAQAAQTEAARKFLRRHFPQAKIFRGLDPGCPILGMAALRAFGEHVFERRKLPESVRGRPAKTTRVVVSKTPWPMLETPLTLTVGKGGVGKTTMSAALAFRHRQKSARDTVTICSIDPAPSLDDVFGIVIGDEVRPVLGDRRLLAAEFDAMAQFQRWAQPLRVRLTEAMTGNERGIHIDLSLDRKFLLALLDVVPPGVDEICAIFRILDLQREDGRVVIDMAPTGHALELLRTPARLLAWTRLLLKTLAAHRSLPMARDAAVEIATLSQNVRELSSILRDLKRSRLLIVTLPEPLPNQETQRLLRALQKLQAPIAAVIVNRVLIGDMGGCARCRLAAKWQAFSLATLRQQMGNSEVLLSREWNAPIAGARALRTFTGALWRIKSVR